MSEPRCQGEAFAAVGLRANELGDGALIRRRGAVVREAPSPLLGSVPSDTGHEVHP